MDEDRKEGKGARVWVYKRKEALQVKLEMKW